MSGRIATLTGFALAAEIGDWHRFTGPTIGSFVGLVPSEHYSGDSRSQGSITKVGNAHVRRLLVEAAWHHQSRYRPGKTLRARWELAPAAARARGDAGNRRLHARWINFKERKKKPATANNRNRPGTGRLVLVIGPLKASDLLYLHPREGRWQRVEHTRARTMRTRPNRDGHTRN